MLIRPRALLLDFHGVIADGVSRPGRFEALADLVAATAGGAVPPDRVRADLLAARAAYRGWRDAMSRPPAPPELSQREFWGDYVAADWPAPARDAVRDAAAELSLRQILDHNDWSLLPGIVDTVAAATAAGLPVAVVSNTLCGEAFRRVIAASPLAGAFAAEIYSDETGVRKPNPAILRLAASRLGVAVEDCWFAGDKPDRDVLCGLRACVGATILVGARTDVATPSWVRPHATVADPVGLHSLLADRLSRSAHP